MIEYDLFSYFPKIFPLFARAVRIFYIKWILKEIRNTISDQIRIECFLRYKYALLLVTSLK